MFNKSLRGQGATEYLVLLAVVLIIALVSIALLGFFPGLASDAKITQSNSYWQGDARPFQIKEHAYTGADGKLLLVLQNVESTGTFTLTALNFSHANGSGLSYTTNTAFAPGETKNISVIGVMGTGTVGAIYELNVNMTYTTPNSITNRQFGSKPLVGKYS